MDKEDLVYMAGWLTDSLHDLSNATNILRDSNRVLSSTRNEGNNSWSIQDVEIEGLKHEISGAMHKINEAGDMIREIHKRLCDLLRGPMSKEQITPKEM